LLLGLARAVTLGPKSRRTQRPYFTLSSETPPTVDFQWNARRCITEDRTLHKYTSFMQLQIEIL
jgi:hypothetical protein